MSDITVTFGKGLPAEALTIYKDDEGRHWHVIGDLRDHDWDDANYDCRNEIGRDFRDVDFDPEFSCFYAYPRTKRRAVELAHAIQTWVAHRRGLDTSPVSV